MISVNELSDYAPPVCADCIKRMEGAPDGAFTVCGDNVLAVVDTVVDPDMPWLMTKVLLSRLIPLDVAAKLRDDVMM